MAPRKSKHVTPVPIARPIRTSADLWRALIEKAGLDIEHDLYDAAIVSELRSALNLSGTGPIARLLERHAISVERFVPAFFRAIAPYARMMSELLGVFEAVQAKHTDRSLQIAFRFGDANQEGLQFRLEEFRSWQRTLEAVRALARVPVWDSTALWQLNGALRLPFDRGRPDSDLARNEPYRDWIQTYRRGQWPAAAPQWPPSGHAQLDALLGRAWQVWSTVLAESREAAPNQAELRRAGFGASAREAEQVAPGRAGQGWPVPVLAAINSDHWMASLLEGVLRRTALIQRASPEEADALVEELLHELERVFQDAPEAEVDADVWIEKLSELLDLPIWQKRHELYSAWVMTRIREAIGEERLQFHVVDGVLSFSFGGSHLGSVVDVSPALHLFAELRTAHTGLRGHGRKNAIQPDYSLVASPITDRTSTVLVVECKQYLKANIVNFQNALVDYASGRPKARIILASYGPCRGTVLAGVPPDLQSRLFVVSDLRPGMEDSLAAFRARVQEVVPEPVRRPASDRRAAAPSEIEVTLTWGELPKDLDLHLRMGSGERAIHVSYERMGDLTGPPWALLDSDQRQGHGRETIKIARLEPSVYRLAVHNFSGGDLAGCGACAVVEGLGPTFRLECPATGSGVWWDLFELDGASRSILIRNVIAPHAPFD